MLNLSKNVFFVHIQKFFIHDYGYMSNDDPWMYALIYMRNDVHKIFTKYICIFVHSIFFHLYMYVAIDGYI